MKHVARKRFGQNFLVDHAVIEEIVAAIGVDANDCVVEIGPGLGALTGPLSDARIAKGGAPIHVVEFDRDLVKRFLSGKLKERMVVHEADALAFDFAALLAPGEKLRVVGNLPYNISSPLLFALLPIAPFVRDQHFMLQKEVVERMTAEPGTSAYGRLSVMLQVHYRMEHLFEVPAESFDPPPKVTSAVVRMIPDATLAAQIADRTVFAQLVQRAFSQRRKMLRNSLESYALQVELEASGISATARAEDISPAAYVDYANRIAAQARSINSIL